MNCPNCSHPLQPNSTVDKHGNPADLFECFHCGGHWLSKGLANDLALAQVKSVDAILSQSDITPPALPRCPYCQERLSLIKHDSVATGISIWTCPAGDGNFFPKGELLKFKSAQDAKITFHKLWGIPVNSLAAVLLPVIAVISLASSAPTLLKLVQNPNSSVDTRSQASGRYSTPSITLISSDTIYIYFTTTEPATASLTLTQDGQIVKQEPFSIPNTTIHTLNLTDINPDLQYQYSVTISFASGDQLTLGPLPLKLQ